MKEPTADKPPSKRPSRRGKSDVYLRNGKIFSGIQEIKYIRYDKSQVLRISKEGKGLPPKVSSLPPHIQKIALTLPHKPESRHSGNGPTTPIEDTSDTADTESSESPLETESTDEQVEVVEPIAEIELAETLTIVQEQPVEPQEGIAPPENSIPARKTKVSSRRGSTYGSEAEAAPTDIQIDAQVASVPETPLVESPEPERLPLQVSFF